MIMKKQGLTILVLVVAMSSAWALSLLTPNEIIMLPETSRNLTLTVENLELQTFQLSIKCESELSVNCQETIKLPKNGTEEFWVEIKTDGAGYFSVFISAGNVEKTLFVRVSESPLSLKNILENYNQSLNIVEERTGRTKASSIARGCWFNTFMLYEEGKYEKLSEELETLRYYVEVAMREPPLGLDQEPVELPDRTVALKMGLIPVAFLILLFGLFSMKKKIKKSELKKLSFTQDLIKMKNEAVVVNELIEEDNQHGKSE